jgi:hypothetical protein
MLVPVWNRQSSSPVLASNASNSPVGSPAKPVAGSIALT